MTTLYQTLPRKKSWQLITGLFFVLVFGWCGFRVPVCAAKDDVVIHMNAVAITRGYTAQSFDGLAQAALQANAVHEPVTIKLGIFPDPVPDAPNLVRVSDVWVVDIQKQDATQGEKLTLSAPLWLSLKYSGATLYKKQLYVLDRGKDVWMPLRSMQDVKTSNVRGVFPYPYAPFAVFEDATGVVGKASWFRYGTPLAAASNDFPLGSVLRVTDLGNKKTVDVVVKSTGPFVGGRVIDLSCTAFKKLRRLSEGITTVRVELLKKP